LVVPKQVKVLLQEVALEHHLLVRVHLDQVVQLPELVVARCSVVPAVPWLGRSAVGVVGVEGVETHSLALEDGDGGQGGGYVDDGDGGAAVSVVASLVEVVAAFGTGSSVESSQA
jgi:hypothetical protein